MRSAWTLPILAVASTGLVGCTLLYPRFDNPLNPDIAFLNAGDVVDSVKCAVATFLLNHRTPIEVEERRNLLRDLKKNSVQGREYCPRGVPFGDPEKEPKEWKVVFYKWSGDKCVLDPRLILQANDEDKSVTIIKNGKPEHTVTYSGPKDLAKKLMANLPGLGGQVVSAWRECGDDDYYHTYKYIKLVEKKDDAGRVTEIRCVPNGGCRPGTSLKNGKCDLDDEEGALAIDPDSNAKIELSLTAVNQGSMNYTRIDANKLDVLRGIIVPGDSSKGFPFPMLKATDKRTNKVDIAVIMSQGKITEHKQKGSIADLTKAIEEVRKTALKAKRPAAPEQYLAPETRIGERDRLYERVLKDLEKEAGEYGEKCKGNVLKVGFLGLADYIENIVSEQEKQIYKGSPEVSLENIVLTSQFQIAFDATAGTQHLLRIVPVLVPPTLQLNPDHTHQLKLTLKGSKGRKTPTKALSAFRRCVGRVEKITNTDKAREHCSSPFAIQLESLIEAVEDSKSAAAN